MKNPCPDPLRTAKTAILDAVAALRDVHPDPKNPLSKTALVRALTELRVAENSVNLAQNATTQTATATGHRTLPPGQARACL